ncbi:MAG: hypothetical protein QM780_15105 [Hyphomicrobium sp.]|uniref:hypothetical protein n=1 Tax=Hyphomicrobium sp. TaxID=82 RepID=UPI0039E62DB2
MTTQIAFILCFGLILGSELLFYWFTRRPASGAFFGSELERAQRKVQVARVLGATLFFISSLGKLGIYFGWIPPDVRHNFLPLLGLPFLLAIAHYFKARWNVKRIKDAAGGGVLS